MEGSKWDTEQCKTMTSGRCWHTAKARAKEGAAILTKGTLVKYTSGEDSFAYQK